MFLQSGRFVLFIEQNQMSQVALPLSIRSRRRRAHALIWRNPWQESGGFFMHRAAAAGFLAVLSWFCAALPAQAIYLSRSGASATLGGAFAPGDDKVFADFLADPSAPALHILYLNSYGGALEPALVIARAVRKARLTTAVYADTAVCDSACTLVFAAGVKRHYIGAQSVQEGFNSLSGLGFHPGYNRGDRVRFSQKSEAAVALMNALYAEMGQPQSAELVAKAGINSVYRPGGETSLRLRIATSLAPP